MPLLVDIALKRAIVATKPQICLEFTLTARGQFPLIATGFGRFTVSKHLHHWLRGFLLGAVQELKKRWNVERCSGLCFLLNAATEQPIEFQRE